MANPVDALAAMAKKLAEMEAENTKLKAAAKSRAQGLRCKVSVKGALSVYGMGRWPVTLYRSQWERLLSDSEVGTIKAFIQANVGSLKLKGEGEDGDTATPVTGDTATAPAKGATVAGPASKTPGL